MVARSTRKPRSLVDTCQRAGGVTGVPASKNGVAAPSANRYQQLSPTTAAHVLKGLDGRVDLVLDGGPTPFGIESTVVDLTHSPPRLLRHGSLAHDLLRMAIPSLVVLDAPAEETGEALPSPGMVRRHYAPRATLRAVAGEALDEAVATALGEGARPVGVVALEGARVTPRDGVVTRSLPRDAEAYGRSLFAVLHALDDLGCQRIVVPGVVVIVVRRAHGVDARGGTADLLRTRSRPCGALPGAG